MSEEQDMGVSPSGPGSRASHEAASASSPKASIPDAIDPDELDDIAHALGRPKSPDEIATAYRNYYCVGEDSDISARNRESLFWAMSGTINDGRDAVWQVTQAGKAVLAGYLAQGTLLREDPKGLRPQASGPVGEADAPTPPDTPSDPL